MFIFLIPLLTTAINKCHPYIKGECMKIFKVLFVVIAVYLQLSLFVVFCSKHIQY